MIIGRGAEAILEKKGEFLIKDRIKKGYRIQEIDSKLRKDRTRKEMRLMLAARRNKVNVPAVYESGGNVLRMELLKGKALRDKLDVLVPEALRAICNQIGEQVARLHNAGIVHGDLTTSNMLLGKDEVFFIDFGLGDFSNKVEDRAVDLHLLKEALLSKHNKVWERCFDMIIEAYKMHAKEAQAVISRMQKIESRGRYTRKAPF
jgi:Kae1-associated kinase Bud32